MQLAFFRLIVNDGLIRIIPQSVPFRNFVSGSPGLLPENMGKTPDSSTDMTDPAERNVSNKFAAIRHLWNGCQNELYRILKSRIIDPGEKSRKTPDKKGHPVENVKCDLQNSVKKRRKLIRKGRTI